MRAGFRYKANRTINHRPLGIGLIELSTREHFATWLPGGAVLRGWARSASGDAARKYGIDREGD